MVDRADALSVTEIMPKKQQQPDQELVTFAAWSREWWAVLFAMIKRKDPVLGFYLHHAKQPQKSWTVPKAEMPIDSEVAKFATYPSNGSEMRNWRPWFEQRGIRLPEWRDRIWVFLPAPSPNPEAQKTGPPNVEGLMTEDDLHELAENG